MAAGSRDTGDVWVAIGQTLHWVGVDTVLSWCTAGPYVVECCSVIGYMVCVCECDVLCVSMTYYVSMWHTVCQCDILCVNVTYYMWMNVSYYTGRILPQV